MPFGHFRQPQGKIGTATILEKIPATTDNRVLEANTQRLRPSQFLDVLYFQTW